ncbi:hypothetical protein JAAARDRAFT_28204 [Jaapia argillacea MUCL 33604]|uniref:J domain-containing protein n=1 Tax=Jaapia argillacea MUCL 33604 TaxID=933084 RepID=A0A067QEF8_9AGAM|nr:hypothetical protein JAAARDRAFT_28204 [Jaapia argillacea MUCL 33604]
MKLLFAVFALLAVATSVLAWTKEDYEIFDLAAAVEQSEGKGTTFYSWLDIPSTASTTEIGKAYRKKSVRLHPDKNPGVKGAHERFARLGVIASILRSSEGRERYDFFHKNGFPKWKGTGYYYSRFRPGLVTVLAFLTILTSGLQYLVHNMNYKRDLARIEKFVTDAKTAAWGAKMIPLEGQRKVRVNLGGPTRVDDEGNVIGGKTVDMVVEGNDVFILESDGSLTPLDTSAATPPSIRRTWFISFLASLSAKYIPKKSSRTEDSDDSASELETVEGFQVDDNDLTSTGEVSDVGSTNGSANGALKNGRATAAVKAGGKRRKAVRKR